MKRILWLLLLAGAVAWVWHATRPVRYPPGVLVPQTPTQREVAAAAAWIRGGWTLRSLAEYEIRARLLSRRSYSRDPMADLCALDFALGWGRMSDQAVLDRVSVWQRGRFYFWSYDGAAPIPREEITVSSANVHLIPATPEVEASLERMRAGDLIWLRGRLVEATQPGRPTVRSSLRRDDSGPGACEVMWVEAAVKQDNGGRLP